MSSGLAVAQYDPRTGRYVGPDGQLYRHSDLVNAPKTWKDMLLAA
ncbi:virulence factor mce family domain protein [Mycobacterium kansasii]|uniref:Virulence factor mce family domain protein n=1 Tax=Mycobacterium kansasii TaxID=1768 RepID=A0A1V3WTN2_MYCKA|nr:virulence factor mce family domain protein [Mycobacterium kansasii]